MVRISGANLSTLVEALTLRTLEPRFATLADFIDANGLAIDQGIALYFPAPNSYTGEDVIELQGHGGPAVMQLLLRRCLELGCRIARPGEFTERAFLNGKIDLAQAEGVADLIEASSEAAAKSAAEAIKKHFSLGSIGCELFGIRSASPGQSPLCRLDVLRDGLDAAPTSRG